MLWEESDELLSFSLVFFLFLTDVRSGGTGSECYNDKHKNTVRSAKVWERLSNHLQKIYG